MVNTYQKTTGKVNPKRINSPKTKNPHSFYYEGLDF